MCVLSRFSFEHDQVRKGLEVGSGAVRFLVFMKEGDDGTLAPEEHPTAVLIKHWDSSFAEDRR